LSHSSVGIEESQSLAEQKVLIVVRDHQDGKTETDNSDGKNLSSITSMTPRNVLIMNNVINEMLQRPESDTSMSFVDRNANNIYLYDKF
jgi:hypothetical protein